MRYAALVVVVLSILSPLVAQQPSPNDPELSLMKEYTEAPAPSGYEGPVRRLFVRDLRALGADVSYDGMGSVIGVVRGESASPRIMIDAHLDEVGLMVQYIRPDGFISFQTLGGIANAELLDQRWVIVTNKGLVPAITGIPDAHIWPADERGKVLPREKVFLDVGAKSRGDAEALGIRPGDPVAPAFPFTVLADGRYAAKAWDDRVGLLVMLGALKQIRAKGITTPNTLYFAGTTQEEIGLRGAHTAVQDVKPDLGIALEVGIAGDVPGAIPEVVQERLGGGPALFLYDSSMIPNVKLRNFVMLVAARNHIPLQTEVISGSYGEDGREIQRYGDGRPVVNLTVPARYTHAHASVIDREDFDHAVDLVAALLEQLDANTVRELASFGPRSAIEARPAASNTSSGAR